MRRSLTSPRIAADPAAADPAPTHPAGRHPAGRRQVSVAPLAVALLALTALTAPLALSACAPQSSSGGASSPSGSSGTAAAGSCRPASLKTLTSRTLTVGTSEPAYAPWVVDDDPTSGKGYEAAVAYAVAEQLGYSAGHVKWVRADFDAAIAPGAKPFDIDLNQYTITQARKKSVDFSSPYYAATQAVVTTASSKAASATSIADLKGLRLGAQVGTTSLSAITSAIGPSTAPSVFNSTDDAVLALKNGQIDAVVVDLPTAFYMASSQLDHGRVVGQLPGSGAGESFGIVLDKGSPLTTCVSGAVDALRNAGTLTSLQKTWLEQAASAPVLS